MAANIYGSIAEAWVADATLNALLPAANISTGRKEDADAKLPGNVNAELPYAVIETVGENREGRSSKGTWWDEQLQISIFCSSLTAARAVQKRARTVLDAMVPVIDDGTLVSWTRDAGGRATESGGVGMAFDTYTLRKQQNR